MATDEPGSVIVFFTISPGRQRRASTDLGDADPHLMSKLPIVRYFVIDFEHNPLVGLLTSHIIDIPACSFP